MLDGSAVLFEFSHGSDPQTGVDDAARSMTETDRHSISFVNSEVRKPFPEFRLMYSSARFQFDLEPGSFFTYSAFPLDQMIQAAGTRSS